MKKQGLITTIEELRTLADELEDKVELNKLQVIKDSGWDTKFELPIINKSGLSDEWEFEKEPKTKIQKRKITGRAKKIKVSFNTDKTSSKVKE